MLVRMLHHCNRIPLFIISGILLFSFSTLAREYIALAELNSQGVSESAASIISDRLRNDLFATGLFTVIERSQMDQILKEQGFQQSGCTTDACAVEVGQLLGVQYIVVGSVGLLGKTYTITVRLIDVKTGQIIRSAAVDCRCEIDDLLKKSVPDIAKQLSQIILANNQNPANSSQGKVTATPAASAEVSNNDAPVTAVPAESRTPIKTKPGSVKPAKNRLVPRVIAGVVTAGAVGAGLYFNSVVQNETAKSNDLYAQYKAAGGAMDESTYLSQIKKHSDNAASASAGRLISYIVAGIGAVGLTLTFVF